MNVDRNARIMSTAVLLFAVALTLFLASNPRGQGGWFFGNNRNETRDTSDFNPARVIGDSNRSLDLPAEDDGLDQRAAVESSRVQEHLSQLTPSNLQLSRDEIATVVADTMYDAVAKLRPYWLNEELRAAVTVGGQLVGGVTALQEIDPTLVDEARLAFSATEPHWMIQVFLEP